MRSTVTIFFIRVKRRHSGLPLSLPYDVGMTVGECCWRVAGALLVLVGSRAALCGAEASLSLSRLETVMASGPTSRHDCDVKPCERP